jgi:hypothetical protein
MFIPGSTAVSRTVKYNVAYRGEAVVTERGEGIGDTGLFGGGEVGISRDVRGEVAVRAELREERDSLRGFGEFGPRMAAGSSITRSLTT